MSLGDPSDMASTALKHLPQHYLRPRQTIGQSQRNKETGEPDDATSIQSGSAGGWEKRPKWTSLAAYPASTFHDRFFLRKLPQLFCLQRRHVGYINFGTLGLANSIRRFVVPHEALNRSLPS